MLRIRSKILDEWLGVNHTISTQLEPTNQPKNMNEYEYDNESESVVILKLTKQEYMEIERMMQFPEDIEEYDRSNKPTNLTEIGF